MRSPIVFRGTVAFESMAGQDHCMPVVCQYVFNFFVERPTRQRHRLTRELVQALLALPGTRESPSSWYREYEVVGAVL
jgi:hypothetical protein